MLYSSTGEDHGRGQTPPVSSVKLFVGSVPKTATEEEVQTKIYVNFLKKLVEIVVMQIRPLFERFGEVLEVALIRDRESGTQKGI